MAGTLAATILTLILSASSLAFAQNSCPQPSPEEWLNQAVPWPFACLNVDQVQKNTITAIHARTVNSLRQAEPGFRANRTSLYQRFGIGHLAATDIDITNRYHIRMQMHSREEGEILPLLTEQQRMSLANINRHMSIPNMQGIQATQKRDLWCWAAAVQMLFASKGEKIEQDAVAQQIIGIVKDTRIRADELANGIGRWALHVLSRDFASEPYVINGIQYIPPQRSREDFLWSFWTSMLHENPLMVATNNGHIVMAYKVGFRVDNSQILTHPFPGYGPGIAIESITYFDPQDGRTVTLSADEAYTNITHVWGFRVMLRGQRIFDVSETTGTKRPLGAPPQIGNRAF